MARYAIFEGNFERITKRMHHIQKKAEKFGCAFKFETIGEEYREILDENNKKQTLRFILVDAEGIAKINGWQFVAEIEHTEGGNIIRKSCDIEIPKTYYTADTVCEHCQSKRQRKFTYLIVNENGDFKQVGKTCLKDFTNGLDAGLVASYIAAFAEIIAGEAPNTEAYNENYIPTIQYLEYAAETIKCFGYTKKDAYSQNRSTAQRAKDYYLSDQQKETASKWAQANLEEMAACGFDAQTEENAKFVRNALAWLNQQEASNDYMNNLKTVCGLSYLKDTHLGIASSLFVTYQNALDRQARQQQQEAAANSSEWVGEIGQRINIEIAKITCVTGWETEWGFTGVYKITDINNNIFTWKTSNFIPDDAKTIKGTVKNHTEYKGIKQTELTRCIIK